MISNIVGAHFRSADGTPAKVILQHLPGGSKLVLRREPTNHFDPNAIQVWVQASAFPAAEQDGPDWNREWWSDFAEAIQGYGIEVEEFQARPQHHLGYIPAVEAVQWANRMDQFTHDNPESQWQWVGALTYSAKGAPAIEWELLAVEAYEG